MDVFRSTPKNCVSSGEIKRDDSHQEPLETHRAEPSLLDPWSTSRLSTILSARSYPIPPNLSKTYATVSESPLLYGGLVSPRTSHRSINSPTIGYVTTKAGRKPAKRHESEAAMVSDELTGKYKRRSLRSTSSDCESGHDVLERRRKQIRTAQRAYRSRQIDKLNDAEKRIGELETTIQNMTNAVICLHDKLIRSETLSQDTHAMSQLQSTMQICLRSIRTSDTAEDEDSLALHQRDQGSADNSTHPLPSPRQFIPSHARQNDFVPVSIFIEQLHLTCIYQGFLTLSDSSIMLDHLQTPFRLLLEIMDRDRLATFFEAALHARLSQKRLEGWEDVPFFSLGGAGTHNSESKPRRGKTTYTCQYHQPCSIVNDPLSKFSSDVKEELNGDWLDMQELEQFLHQKAVHLIACPTQPDPALSERTISVAYLIKRRFITGFPFRPLTIIIGLIRKAVCLGRSPGFRRRDVERALLVNEISDWT